MALKSLTCPSCGANLNLDDNREFGFCEYCGAKVQIREIIEVRHTGQIKIDNSEQGENLKTLAERSYKAGNYDEALDFYNRAIVFDPNDSQCLYRRALCKIICMRGTNFNTKEFTGDFDLAYKYLKNESNGDLIRHSMQVELNALFNMAYNKMPSSASTKSNEEEARYTINFWIDSIDLLYAIVSKMLDEDYKESALHRLLSFFIPKPITTLKYYKYHTNSNGGVYRTVETYKPSKQTIDYFERIKDNCRYLYNNLPSRKQKYGALEQKKKEAERNIEKAKGTIAELSGRTVEKIYNPERANEPTFTPYVVWMILLNIPWVISAFVMFISFAISIMVRESSEAYQSASIASGSGCCFFIVFLIIGAAAVLILLKAYKNAEKKFYKTHSCITPKCEYDRLYNARITLKQSEEELSRLEKEMKEYWK